ncbi:MAG: MFS transporter [Prolixibacteraceae bacterium]|nr:MFS transporter [Prolixibacteraceae bacterium]MBN2773152.1 MFS transporter [Prolixibacteraceae bacterium]
MDQIIKDRQYYKFSLYGFLKNLRFFEAFFILFLVEKGLSYTQIGILYAVREISINVFEIPSGIVADTYGRKRSLLGSFIAYMFSFAVFYFSGNFWLFLAAFVLYGIGDAFRTGTHKGMIMDYLRLKNREDQKINYYGHTRSWSQKGSAISSLVAGVIVFYSGSYQNIFLYSIIPYLLNFLLILSYPANIDLSHKNNISGNENNFGFMIKSLIRVIKRPKVLEIVNTSALHSAFLAAVKDYIQPLMVSVALLIPVFTNVEIEKKNGVIIGVFYFFIYLATSYASKLGSKAAKNKATISFITLLAGLSFGLISGLFFIYELWIFSMIAFVGIYLVENIRKPILTGFVADEVPNEILVSVISAQSLLKTIMTGFIALMIGIISDLFGIGQAIMIISVFLILFSFLIDLNRKQKKEYK